MKKFVLPHIFSRYSRIIIFFTIVLLFLGAVIAFYQSDSLPTDHQHLRGNYAPVQKEITVDNLPIEGTIPEELTGAYLRNGPNAKYKPIHYTYPFDGDGMIHAIYLQNGTASYRNRYVRTEALAREDAIGNAIYKGFFKPAIPRIRDLYAALFSKKVTPEDVLVKGIKNIANIHIVYHAGQCLALYETVPAYVMNQQLETLGLWKPNGAAQPLAVNAHTRWDPDNGDRWFFKYGVLKPYLKFYRIDKKGEWVQTIKVKKEISTLMHDFALTQNYIVVFDCPVVFKKTALLLRQPFLYWQPKHGTKIGIIPKNNPKKTYWINTPPFFVYHFVNAYEAGTHIIVDYIRLDKFYFGAEFYHKSISKLYRATIDTQTQSVQHHAMCKLSVEFPTINQQYHTKPYRYVYTPTVGTSTPDTVGPPHNTLVKHDLHTHTTYIHDFGADTSCDEAIFVPKKKMTAEDDGYLLVYVYHKIKATSYLVILDAKELSLLARIKLPQRVPHGLHGSWIPSNS